MTHTPERECVRLVKTRPPAPSPVTIHLLRWNCEEAIGTGCKVSAATANQNGKRNDGGLFLASLSSLWWHTLSIQEITQVWEQVCPSNQSESSVHPICISFLLHLILQAQGLKCLRKAKQTLNDKAAWKWKCKEKENCTLKFWIPLFSYEIWCFMLLFDCKSVFLI